MNDMKQTAFVFGAGKTGRGFAAHLAHKGGYGIILVDKDASLIEHLGMAGKYTVEVLGAPALNCTIHPEKVFHIDGDWISDFIHTRLIFVSVFGNNLEALSKPFARGLAAWLEKNSGTYLNIITCENFLNAANWLREKISLHLNAREQEELNRRVGFSEAIVLSTCLAANYPESLTVRAQNFFELPCDGDALKGEWPRVRGLKPLPNFGRQLQRKIFTYNCINAVITYLGAEKGYTQLYEAGNDPEILVHARRAALETSQAQVREYGFDRDEQRKWVDAAFSKFADKDIPDPIERNGADPVRKLGVNDRLVGPALLATKHGIVAEGLTGAIIAAFHFHDKKPDYSIAHTIREKGLDHVLQQICGLSPGGKLFTMLKERYIRTRQDD